ncbi:MAG: glycosyltransferase family 39 protein [Chloroflexota bacterium]
MSMRFRFALVGVTLLTAVLRTRALFINDFHADEALFGSWARHIAVWRDPLLLTQAVDKPPLLFYLQALFYPFQGPVEWAARLPNYIASIVLVPLVGVVVWRLLRRWETTVFAAALVAFSPMHIQFSASAFTDPLLTTFLFAAVALQLLWANLRSPIPNPQSPFLCGLFFGLSILTKHQAWLFLPLILATGLLIKWRRRNWLAWLRGFLPLLLVGWGWELVRNGRLTLISAQVDNVGGFGLVEWAELGNRFVEWGKLGQYVVSYWVVGVLVIGFLTQRHKGCKGGKERKKLSFVSLSSSSLCVKYVLHLFAFIFGYSALHLFLDIPVWDRYFLPLVPLTAVLLAGVFHQIKVQPNWRIGYWLLVIGVLVPGAVGGMNGRFPIGARPFADSGVGVVANSLADEPYGTVLYDHWYSWHWRYHLFDKKVHLNWFPDEDELVIDLNGFYEENAVRYLALPNDARSLPVESALDDAGYLLQQVPIAGESDIILYRIELEE